MTMPPYKSCPLTGSKMSSDVLLNLQMVPGLSVFMVMVLLLLNFCLTVTSVPVTGSFQSEFNITWSGNNVMIFNDGNMIQLVLDNVTRSGSGFTSKHQYLFGRIDMQIKLVPGDSAGTITAYYLSSQTDNHDEVDFEFLGNSSGDPYILQTNLYASGVGAREQRIRLWFDPSSDFHSYSVFWNKYHIIFLVDNIPIRVYENHLGIAFPSGQPMGIYSSIWDGDSWATRNGAQKLNWSHAPFIASYQNYYIDGCQWSQPIPACGLPNATNWWDGTQYQKLDGNQMSYLEWVKKNYMVYDYCLDTSRFPSPPTECSITN
ncbi:hypothetical protein O6H91_07G127000 [Diphasiastrum complanatum]|uniref:Uncharacterized protein n=1 Tax=Diphasiastrum complanatum TaxID=34168 RepID=A0ACC2D9Q3_DIPCM|nr:hypothetical protein O6H91_Y311000 [Diphasiastrum complanatum]KAJ7550969.1 hypothetical protein O6H91_07G127000 [Diphasiastrum complanatum]